MEPTECSIQDTLNITEDEVSQWLYNSTDKVMIVIILPTILGLCTLFNFIFLFVVYRVPEVRSDTTVYLINLALADFLYVVTSMCFYLVQFIRSPVKLHQTFTHSIECWLVTLSILPGYATSIALVTMMSFEIYLALCHPIKHLRIRGRRRTLKIIGFCWLIGFIYALLELPGNAILQTQCVRWPNDDTYQMLPSSITVCRPIHPWVSQYTQVLVTIPWFISMFGNVYMYARIILVLHKRSGINGRKDMERKALQIRNQVAKMLVVNGMVFFICQTPCVVIFLLSWLFRVAHINNSFLSYAFWNEVRWFIYLPQYVNTFVNPVIYGLTNRQYRAAFVQALHLKASLNGQQRTLRSVCAISTHCNPSTNAKQENAPTNEGDNDRNQTMI